MHRPLGNERTAVYIHSMYAPVNYPYPQQVNKSSVIALLNGGQASAPWILKNAPRTGRKRLQKPYAEP